MYNSWLLQSARRWSSHPRCLLCVGRLFPSHYVVRVVTWCPWCCGSGYIGLWLLKWPELNVLCSQSKYFLQWSVLFQLEEMLGLLLWLCLITLPFTKAIWDCMQVRQNWAKSNALKSHSNRKWNIVMALPKSAHKSPLNQINCWFWSMAR